MSNSKAKNTDKVTLRNEMRTEIRMLKERMDQMQREMQTEIDAWREKYNALFLENGKLSIELKAIKTQLTHMKDQSCIVTNTRIFDNIAEH